VAELVAQSFGVCADNVRSATRAVCQATDSPGRDVHLVLDNYATQKHGT